jgi:hypothetical protein
MKKNTVPDNPEERRSEPRIVLDQYYSVEFQLKDTGNVYKFKLRDISSNGLGILANADSAVLKHLKVGDSLDMKYYPSEASEPTESLKTRIMHITPKKNPPFKGHFIIGLLITEKQTLDP